MKEFILHEKLGLVDDEGDFDLSIIEPDLYDIFAKKQNEMIDDAWKLARDGDLEGALNIVHKAFPQNGMAWYCAAETIARVALSPKWNEHDVHNWFKKNCKNILGDDYSVIRKKINRQHIPDVWVTDSKHDIPVEIKAEQFDKRALKQLLRYMDFYKADSGIAVAQGLTVELPGNIQFVKFTDDDIRRAIREDIAKVEQELKSKKVNSFM